MFLFLVFFSSVFLLYNKISNPFIYLMSERGEFQIIKENIKIDLVFFFAAIFIYCALGMSLFYRIKTMPM